MEALLLRWLDVLLGVAELLLVPASVVYLAMAVFRPSRRRAMAALALAGVLALTLAQPFGVKSEPITPEEFAAGNPQPAEAEAVHSVRVLGVPVFGFRPYRGLTVEPYQPILRRGQTGIWLKIRSWVWPGLLTNGSKVAFVCEDSVAPCWTPEGEAEPTGRPSKLDLVQADGEWRYHVRSPSGGLPQLPDKTGSFGFYRLSPGIVSWIGLLYWIALPAFAGAVILSLRRRSSAEPGALSAT
jgi:hypothetical protein